MLAIRLRRVGSKKQPLYRVVVCDSAKATDGRFVEILGYYNPSDLGRMIGRRGRTASALRALASMAAEMEGSSVTVEFRDGSPDDGR